MSKQKRSAAAQARHDANKAAWELKAIVKVRPTPTPDDLDKIRKIAASLKGGK